MKSLIIYFMYFLASTQLYAQEERFFTLEELHKKVVEYEKLVTSEYQQLKSSHIDPERIYDSYEKLTETVPRELLTPTAKSALYSTFHSREFGNDPLQSEAFQKIDSFLHKYDYLLKLRAYFIAKYHHAQVHELLDQAIEIKLANKRSFTKSFKANYKRFIERYDLVMEEFHADLRNEPLRRDKISVPDRWLRSQGHLNFSPAYFASLSTLLDEIESSLTHKPLWQIKLRNFRNFLNTLFSDTKMWLNNMTILPSMMNDISRFGNGSMYRFLKDVMDKRARSIGGTTRVVHEGDLPSVIKDVNGQEKVQYHDRSGKLQTADIVFFTSNHPSPATIPFAQSILTEKLGHDKCVGVTSALDVFDAPGLKELNVKGYIERSRDLLYVKNEGLENITNVEKLSKSMLERLANGRRFFFLYPQGDGTHSHDADIHRYVPTVAEFLPILAQRLGLRIAVVPVNMSSFEHTLSDIYKRHPAFGKDFVVEVSKPLSQEAFNLMAHLRRSNVMDNNKQSVLFRIMQFLWLEKRNQRFNFQEGIIPVEDIVGLNRDTLFEARELCPLLNTGSMARLLR